MMVSGNLTGEIDMDIVNTGLYKRQDIGMRSRDCERAVKGSLYFFFCEKEKKKKNLIGLLGPLSLVCAIQIDDST